MTESVILDRYAEANVPQGYLQINTEIDFLRYADSAHPMLIRGDQLCEWAANYFRGREIAYSERRSPIRQLTAALPGIAQEQIRDIYSYLQDNYDSLPQPISASAILQATFPLSLWSEAPSIHHAAKWLEWLLTTEVPKAIRPVLTVISTYWQTKAPGNETLLYRATNRNEALDLLFGWLKVKQEPKLERIPPYPDSVSEKVLEYVRQEWYTGIVQSHGALLRTVLSHVELSRQLKVAAAALGVKYFTTHPQDLNSELLRIMLPYLDARQQAQLQKFVAPPKPGTLPSDPSAIFTWYRQQYLPYRLWQHIYGDDDTFRIVSELAHQFSTWYLEQYPKALVGSSLSPLLSFNRSSKMANTPNDTFATLIAVLDGLHFQDAQYVLQSIQQKTTRLTTGQDGLLFAPLPTVTEFCKDALLKGTAPVNAPKYPHLGTVISERQSPAEILQTAKAGDLYWWRVQEPDATYHKRNSHEMLLRDVESVLDGIGQKIVDVVNGVNPGVPLRIVVTTDHGRLLSTSERALLVPDGMTSHGRAAWGNTKRSFPGSGYLMEDDVVYLHRERFGLPSDAAIAISEAAFKTNDDRRGSEIYPHGGLFPEEVIIPWHVLLRDVGDPDLKVKISGRGLAKSRGQAEIVVMNMSEIQVSLQSVQLISSQGPAHRYNVELDCLPSYRSSGLVVLDPWPTPQDLNGMQCTAEFRLPGQRTIVVEITVQLEADEMYQSNENILDDLGI